MKMGFGHKDIYTSKQKDTNRVRFVGRHSLINEYKQNFNLLKHHPDVYPIVTISGMGGVGKSYLVNQLMRIATSDTIYSKIDATDDIGDDITQLLGSLCRSARLANRSVDFIRTSLLLAKRNELVDKYTGPAMNVSTNTSALFSTGVRLTVDQVLGIPAPLHSRLKTALLSCGFFL